METNSNRVARTEIHLSLLQHKRTVYSKREGKIWKLVGVQLAPAWP